MIYALLFDDYPIIFLDDAHIPLLLSYWLHKVLTWQKRALVRPFYFMLYLSYF